MVRIEAYTSETHINNIDALIPIIQSQMTFIGSSKTLDETRQALLNALQPGNRAVLFVAYNDLDLPIAFAFGNAGVGLEIGDYFWLNEIHVDETYRGVGHASRFLLWIEKWLEDKNIHYIATMTSTDNTASQKLFKKSGFDVEKVMWMDKEMNKE